MITFDDLVERRPTPVAAPAARPPRRPACPGARIAETAAAVTGVLSIAGQPTPATATQQRLARSLEARGNERLTIDPGAVGVLSLLFGSASRVLLGGEMRVGDQETAVGAQQLTIGTERLRRNAVALRDVRLTRDGSTFTASAVFDRHRLLAAAHGSQAADGQLYPLPGAGEEIRLLGSRPGDTAVVVGTLRARDGAVVASPSGPLGALVDLRVFRDPRVWISGLRTETSGPDEFRVSVSGHLL